jgi:hypothetical protein
MLRRGQVTLFALIGLFVVAFVALLYFGGSQDVTVEHSSFAKPVAVYVQSCLDESLSHAIPILARHGGYNDVVTAKHVFMGNLPYYFSYEVNLAPTILDIEREFENHMQKSFVTCVDSFASFDYLDVNYDVPQFSVQISPDVVSVELDFPFSVKSNSGAESYDLFMSEKETSYGALVAFAQDIADEQSSKENEIPLSYITQYAYDKGLVYLLTYDKDNSVVVTITEPEEELNFVFALRYDWEEEVET